MGGSCPAQHAKYPTAQAAKDARWHIFHWPTLNQGVANSIRRFYHSIMTKE